MIVGIDGFATVGDNLVPVADVTDMDNIDDVEA